VWEIHKKCVTIDQQLKEKGSFISDYNAYNILKEYGYSNTIQNMRKVMSKSEHDYNSDKMLVTLIEILMCKYNVAFKILQNAAAQEMVRYFRFSKQQNEAQTNILNKLKINVDLAKKMSQEALEDMELVSKYEEAVNKNIRDLSIISKESENTLNTLSRVKERSKTACNELNFHEIDYVTKKQKLKEVSNDMTLSISKRNKAKVELDMLSNEKPITFQSAKICQEAITRKLIMSEAFVRKKIFLIEDIEKTIDQMKKLTDESKTKASKSIKRAEDFIQEAQMQLRKTILDGSKEESSKNFTSNKFGYAGTIFYLERELMEASNVLKLNANHALKTNYLPLKRKSNQF